ncbi:putative secreted protein [Rhodopirellula europaea SH398]|uniref:Putative secreted protein n=1 Tax=Rhodopirellula europaea SH398 TaxID=1263868 RepID=M5RXM0_9BACT|nr:putative secreted protein [Rhodopirellula europaea SH398]
MVPFFVSPRRFCSALAGAGAVPGSTFGLAESLGDFRYGWNPKAKLQWVMLVGTRSVCDHLQHE